MIFSKIDAEFACLRRPHKHLLAVVDCIKQRERALILLIFNNLGYLNEEEDKKTIVMYQRPQAPTMQQQAVASFALTDMTLEFSYRYSDKRYAALSMLDAAEMSVADLDAISTINSINPKPSHVHELLKHIYLDPLLDMIRDECDPRIGNDRLWSKEQTTTGRVLWRSIDTNLKLRAVITQGFMIQHGGQSITRFHTDGRAEPVRGTEREDDQFE
ncbi:MAG: hypothetical protein M1828_005259 [Chrysothrix sp. TS-e1954]|nr:MAG: hypothetical protein M1828_005259 [Chrysothrix sp. TS-e1954]